MCNDDNNFVKTVEDDQVIARLGFSLIQILESYDMVTKKLIIVSRQKKYYKSVVDKNV